MDSSPLMMPLELNLDGIVTAIFYIVIGIYALFCAVLYFHWDAYSIDKNVTKLTLLLFFLGSLPLVAIMSIMVLII